MSPPFGSFSPFCSSPSSISGQEDVSISTAGPLPHCNLFFRALLKITEPPALTTLFPFSDVTGTSDNLPLGFITSDTNVEDLVAARAVNRAGVGVGIRCDPGRLGIEGSLGDIAHIVVAHICFLVIVFLIFRGFQRKAAVGRVEFIFFLVFYSLTFPLRIFTTANILKQGSSGLAVLSAVHVGLIAGIVWILLGNAIVATQIVPDGSTLAIVPIAIAFLVSFGITTYIGLDQAFGLSQWFTLQSETAEVGQLTNIALWVLSVLLPYLTIVLYLSIMLYIVYFDLHEARPCLWFGLSFLLFASSQVVLLLASQPLCEASDGKLTSAFLSTLLETGAVTALYVAWTSITEADWEEPIDVPEPFDWQGYDPYKY